MNKNLRTMVSVLIVIGAIIIWGYCDYKKIPLRSIFRAETPSRSGMMARASS